MKEFRKSIYRMYDEDIPVPTICYLANVTISSVDAEASDDGTVWLRYMACDGSESTLQFSDAGFFANTVCVNINTDEAFYYFVGGEALNAGSCDLQITTNECGI